MQIPRWSLEHARVDEDQRQRQQRQDPLRRSQRDLHRGGGEDWHSIV